MKTPASRPPALDQQSIVSAAELLARRDPALQKIYETLGPPPLWKRPATFATFVRIILEQQVSLASAKSTFDRTRLACGGQLTAGKILDLGEDRLRSLGHSRQKARYVSALALDVVQRRFVVGRLPRLEDDLARLQITGRLGLGEWSADIFLLMSLCRPDIFPTGDLALVKGLEEIDDALYPSLESLLARGDAWRPFRSVATRMIWQHYLARRRSNLLP